MKNTITRLKLLITAAAFSATASVASAQSGLAPALNDAVLNPDGSYSNWFGTYFATGEALQDADWIYHTDHGFLYLAATGEDLWIYDPNVDALGEALDGWLYTSRDFFPFFAVHADTPLYLLFVRGAEGPATTPRVFVNAESYDSLFLSKDTTQTIVDIAVGNPAFSSLVTAVSTAGLVETLSSPGPFTVFAPTNDAFAALDPDTLNDLLTNPESLGALTGILTYHVVEGRVLSGDLGLDLSAILRGEAFSGFVTTVGGADLRVDVTPFGIMLNGTTMVATPDVVASNGVIHVIDQVLLPPKDIVDTAIDAGFSTLVAAVQAAGLEDTLRAPGNLTVFAPTDDAFAALGTDTINALLADPETLANILAYHVVGAKVYASEVSPGPVTMSNTDEATLSVGMDGGLMINDANIILTDVPASNGVIHVIDAVILPPSE